MKAKQDVSGRVKRVRPLSNLENVAAALRQGNVQLTPNGIAEFIRDARKASEDLQEKNRQVEELIVKLDEATDKYTQLHQRLLESEAKVYAVRVLAGKLQKRVRLHVDDEFLSKSRIRTLIKERAMVIQLDTSEARAVYSALSSIKTHDAMNDWVTPIPTDPVDVVNPWDITAEESSVPPVTSRLDFSACKVGSAGRTCAHH